MQFHPARSIAVIGAGTAGLSAFKEASKFTDDVVLIDHGPLGTTCARVGCMPSKIFIQVANDYFRRHVFAKQGIVGAQHLSMDIPKTLQHVRQLRDYFANGVVKVQKRSVAGLLKARLNSSGHNAFK